MILLMEKVQKKTLVMRMKPLVKICEHVVTPLKKDMVNKSPYQLVLGGWLQSCHLSGLEAPGKVCGTTSNLDML